MRILLLILLSFSLSSFYERKEFRTKQFPGPDGTMWVSDSIFMDAKEVTNKEYREFIQWLRKKYTTTEPYAVTKELPDTLVWRKFGGYAEDLTRNYFSHPEYNDHPVIGVSFEQARDYCKWRTDRLKEFQSAGDKKLVAKSIPKNVDDYYFRLPGVKEWELGAFAGLDTAKYPYGYYGLSDTVHDVKVNVKNSYSEVVGMSYSAEPVHVLSGIPNEFGFYNMIGNVAEMCSEKGVSKGGSWKHYLDECHIRDSVEYEVPSNWLGFRCVCVVKYKPGCGPPKNR